MRPTVLFACAVILSLSIPPGRAEQTNQPAAMPAKAPPAGDLQAIQNQFNNQALRGLAQYIVPETDIEVEIWLDKEGRVVYAAFFKEGRKKSKEPLDAGERKQIETALASLDSANFKEREAATRTLLKAGENAVTLVRAALDKTTDPEVTERCKLVLAAIDKEISNPEAVAFLKTLSFDYEGARAKSFSIPVSKQNLEAYGGRIYRQNSIRIRMGG